MSVKKIALLQGDGIGPEVMVEAVKAIKAIEKISDMKFECINAKFGASAYFECGASFPEETKAICDEADAIIKAPIGLNKEDSEKIPVEERPERGALLPLRRRYDTYANFRPIKLPKALADFSPLKPEIIGEGLDIMMIRELVGGLYFGKKDRGVNADGNRYVHEQLEYTENQIKRIMHVAFKESMGRTKVLTNIHKSNVLMSSVLWNEVLEEVAKDYPEVEVKHVIVDAAATALCLNPRQFDVMVMENMFGDILSDQGGGILGSLGLMPSACVGDEKSYYEPSHGSAPDIAGKGIANPYSTIGSVALMLEKSFDMKKEADILWSAMQKVFTDGFSTCDLTRPGMKNIGTSEFSDKVIENILAS